MSQFQLTFIVEEEMVLRQFLTMKEISKRTLTAVKYQGGQLLVNDVERDVRYQLQVGDQVKVVFPVEQPSDGLLAEEGDLTVLYEDEAVLLVQKPAGMYTIPSLQNRSKTIANFVAGKFQKEKIPATVHIVTRLDYNTSGLICIAKNRHIHHLLSKQLMAGSFQRSYEAIVEGNLPQEDFIICEPIGRKEGSIIERVVREDGQYAKTIGHVLERFEIDSQPFTRVALTLKTGRTHQIRVHMSWYGYPLAGDDLYGGSTRYINRQALHCKRLTFQHPITKIAQSFTSPFAKDLAILSRSNRRAD